MEQDEIIKNSIQERFNNLQPEIQEVLLDPNYDVKIAAISQKFNLTVDQLKDFEMDTTLVLMGQTHPDDYIFDLTDDLELPEDVLNKIVLEVNESIFKKVKDTLKKNFEDEAEEDTKIVPQNATSPNTTIDQRFSVLPKEIQAAIAASDYQKKLYSIGSRNKLQVTQMGVLEDTTVRLITNTLSPSQYENELALATDIHADIAQKIAKEVNDEVLRPIREAYKEKSVEKKEEVVEDDDDVPIPPYATVAQPIQSTTESDIYKNSGIEIIKEEKQIPKVEIPVMKPTVTPHTLTEEKAVLENITQNDTRPVDIIANKLGGITQNTHIVTDYSLPKVTVQTTPTKIHDPYHEPIEG